MQRARHGRLMGPIVEGLKDDIATDSDLDLFWDHAGGATPAHSFFGPERHDWNHLATVDLLIADRRTHEALWVVEVEETGADPKVLLGDVFSLALAERLEAGAEAFALTPRTELLVCFPAGPKGGQVRRARELEGRIGRLLAAGGRPLRLTLMVVGGREEIVRAVAGALHDRLRAFAQAASVRP